MRPINLQAIDPGVRAVVARLRLAGFETTDSGDGYSKPAAARELDFPHVAAVVSTRALLFGEAERMARVLGDPWRVEATFCPNDGTSLLMATAPAGAVEAPGAPVVVKVTDPLCRSPTNSCRPTTACSVRSRARAAASASR